MKVSFLCIRDFLTFQINGVEHIMRESDGYNEHCLLQRKRLRIFCEILPIEVQSSIRGHCMQQYVQYGKTEHLSPSSLCARNMLSINSKNRLFHSWNTHRVYGGCKETVELHSGLIDSLTFCIDFLQQLVHLTCQLGRDIYFFRRCKRYRLRKSHFHYFSHFLEMREDRHGWEVDA